MNPTRFIATVLGTALVAALAASAFNFAVDPYLLFDRPPVPGFNATKPAAETRERMMKAYQATRLEPRTVIVGSSRTDIGLDPASPSWPQSMRPVYNFSMVGSGIGEQGRSLEALLAATRNKSAPATIIVGLDFESFLDRPRTDQTTAPKPPDEQAERLAALARWNGSIPPTRILLDYAGGLLTIDALKDSAATFAANRARAGPGLASNGKLSDARLRNWTETEGAAALFRQKHHTIIKQYRYPRKMLADTPDGPMRELTDVQALIDLARSHRMKLVLAVQPAHPEHLELLDAMGYWPDYERWKRDLTRSVDEARRAGTDVSLWDFGGYDDVVQEPVPSEGAMQWFWDPVHYTTALGNEVLNALYGAPSRFPAGVYLTPDSIEGRLASIRRDRDEYRRQNAATVQQLRKSACPAGQCGVVGGGS